MADRQLPLDAVADIREQATAYINDEDIVDFVDLVASLELPLEYFEDQRAQWHHIDHEFEAIVRVYLYREITGISGLEAVRRIERWDHIRKDFGFVLPPSQSTISRFWTDYSTQSIREFIQQTGVNIAEAADEANVPQNKYRELATEADGEDELTEEQKLRVTRFARRHVFGCFDSGRAENSKYEDNAYWELQSYLCMSGCGTPQGQRRFKRRSGRPEVPSGDAHLRTVAKFDEADIERSFLESSRRTVELLRDEGALSSSVVGAIDTTPDGNWAEKKIDRAVPEGREKKPYPWAHRYAVLQIVGERFNPVVAITPVVPENPQPGRVEKPKHQIVAELLDQASDIVDFHLIYADRGFDAEEVFRTFDDRNVEFLIPRRRLLPEERIEERLRDSEYPVDIAIHPLRSGEGEYQKEFTQIFHRRAENEQYTIFVTNRDVDLDRAHGMVGNYNRRWQIENTFATIKNKFRAITNSRKFETRYFYFVFRFVLYNIWQIVRVLLELEVGDEIDIEDHVTAGELVDLVSDYLRPIT